MKRTHREALDGLTECGRDPNKEGMDCLPATNHNQAPTCKRCRSQLTAHCWDCREEVLCYRVRMHEHFIDRDVDRLVCATCGRRNGSYILTGERLRQRADREHQRRAREIRKDIEARAVERREREWQRRKIEDADYSPPEGCALCGEPMPGEGMARQRGWTKSRLEFLRCATARSTSGPDESWT